MKKKWTCCLLAFGITVLGGKTFCQEMEVKLKGADSQKLQIQAPDFEITNGSEEIAGTPFNEKAKALEAWQQACKSWENNLKANAEKNHHELISFNCGKAKVEKDNFLFSYDSTGTYKVKVRVRDKK